MFFPELKLNAKQNTAKTLSILIHKMCEEKVPKRKKVNFQMENIGKAVEENENYNKILMKSQFIEVYVYRQRL